MAGSLLYHAIGAPGAIYVVSVVMGSCYGAHWAIVPSAASELFGLKSFGAIYNFLTLASPAGSLIFSGVIASGIYDYEAKKQNSMKYNIVHETDELTCYGTVCYSLTCGILSVLCMIAASLSMTVVYRTKRVYAQLGTMKPMMLKWCCYGRKEVRLSA
ncbi:putative MFS transporter superfamily [Helianthus annuus]|nr:putative MFS transporter superfamily [Helianthus annuus]KAJ0595621.1 putative MFS transporter superfamily [Helianthus annuus]KAJ0756271.1 putative MFS transporter superfamily [Helianthus annuus]KAJ0760054.1 putative MFS transporter superfamily [Helianthus annuus]KAJ0925228.1 putative MFS transporter superfamily [Helianthus annuus]